MIGFASNWFSKVANSVIQLIQVPVLFHFWATAVYGDWIVITAIPTYLAFSNIGFGSVASTEMTLREAAGDREGALAVFQSCWWLISLICVATAAISAVCIYFVPVAQLLDVHAIDASDTKWILLYLGLSVLLGQLEQLIGAAYTCVARYAYGSFLKNLISLAAFGATMVPVVMGHGPRTAALMLAVANSIGTVVFALLMRRDLPWIEFGWRHARFSEIRRLAPLAVAFMGFPIGNALNLQGTSMAVHYALGPVALTVFASARTVSRVALQMVQMVNNTVQPELSLAYGAGDIALLRALHRRACQTALVFALLVVTCMMSFGPWFLTHWTGGHVPPSRPLLAILLVGVVIYSLWSTSSTLPTALNQHKKLAAWYMVATGVTVVVTYVLAVQYGLYGAAASLILSEVMMNVYVLPASLRIVHDTLPEFAASMLHYPESLKPAALRVRLNRSKATFEAE